MNDEEISKMRAQLWCDIALKMAGYELEQTVKVADEVVAEFDKRFQMSLLLERIKHPSA